MASEQCIYKSEHLITDYDICVPLDILGEQVYYYRHCYYLRDFLSECSLSDRYFCNDIIRIVPQDAVKLIKELKTYIETNEIKGIDCIDLNNLIEVLKCIPDDNKYMYYFDFCD